jgi:hypothetical protein
VVDDGIGYPPRPGYYLGRNYTTYFEEVKALKRSGDDQAAERLLLALVDATEAESRATGGVSRRGTTKNWPSPTESVRSTQQRSPYWNASSTSRMPLASNRRNCWSD